MTASPNRARDLFLATVRMTPDRWDCFLAEQCGDDEALRARIRDLLIAHQEAGSFLHPVVVDPEATANESSAEHPGTVIGPYKLLEQIGEGGFGTVFLAEQTEPVRRKVALKVLKPGMDSRQGVARFEAERQALAIMDHPNIAKVFDGGVTPSGRLYFVMELVRGVPITQFCDDEKLAPRERLNLFVQVCHAVQHAHQKGVIHRDLKPSNVLVTMHDATPVVKVIDFGVAKAVGQELTDKTLFTGFAQMVGTPLYMSPEQAGQSGLDVDTRSDIYSLGVLLYELLTGTTPFAKDRFRQAGYDEIRRIICEEEPARPSARISTLGPAAETVSVNRQTDPKRLSRLCRGELDWIVMRCLEKDRGRRYETANALADDVQRYLADEPVLACPPSAGYRLKKFARRNRPQLALAAGLGVLLLGAGAFAWYSDRQAADRKRDVQTRLGRDEEAVAALLDQCEEAVRVNRADRAAIALEAAERRAADGRAEDLAGRLARCRADLGLLRALNEIDDYRWTWDEHAFPDLKVVARRWRAALTDYGVTTDEGRATEAAERVNGSLVRDRVLTALDGWLNIDRLAGVRAILRSADPDQYRDAVRDAVTANDRKRVVDLVGKPDALKQPPRFAVVLGRLSGVPAERSRAVLESALRTRTGNLDLLMAMGDTYPIRRREGATERVRWYQAALAAHPGNLAAQNNLGLALRRTGDLNGAVAVYREAIRLDPNFVRAHSNLGVALKALGELEAAIAAYREAIRLDPDFAFAHSNLGLALRANGDPDGAIARFREAIRLDPNYANARINLGAVLCDVKRDYDGAITAFREAIRLDPTDADGHNGLGLALLEKGDPTGAIASFREGIRVDPQHAHSHNNLGYALLRKGDRDEAIALFKEAIRLDPKFARAHFYLGNALRGNRDVNGAIAAYRESIRLDSKYADAHHNLGHALWAKDDSDGAIAHFKEAIRLNPRLAIAHFNLGAILCDVKRDYDGAIIAFKEAIRLKPKDADAHANLGVALRAKGNSDSAIAAFKEAVGLNPKHTSALKNMGAILCDVKQDYSGAIAAFKEAIRLNPKDAQTYFNLAVALRARGNLDDAIAAYGESIRLDPKDADAHSNLGVALQAKGEIDTALAAFKEALRLDPKHARTHNNLGVILCDVKRDYDGAITAFQAAIRLNPKYVEAHCSLGIARRANGDVDRAIPSFKEALRLDPKHVSAHIHLAWLLATGPDRVRNGKQAIEHAARACELTGQTDPFSISTLAAAHAESGDFDRAIEFQRKALSFPASVKQLGKAGQEQLDLYVRKKPFRDLAFAPRETAPPPREVKP